MRKIKTDPLIKPPCDCRGKDCRLTFRYEGTNYSKYRVTQCLTHSTLIYKDPISIKTIFNFGDGVFIEEVLWEKKGPKAQ